MKYIVIIFVVYLLVNNKTVTENPRVNGKKFLAKFNILESYIDTFKAKLQAVGMEFIEAYDANKLYQGQKLFKITFQLSDTQLTEFDKLKVLDEVEYISLLILE